MPNRQLALAAAYALAVGLVFGSLFGLTLAQTAPSPQAVLLDPDAQDDFIITVAEAYSVDGDMQLAQDRLARLQSFDTPLRVEQLAREYLPQRDVITERLAGLAVAFGSGKRELVALTIKPTPVELPAASTELAARPAEPQAAPQAPAAAPVPTELAVQPETVATPAPGLAEPAQAPPAPPAKPEALAQALPTPRAAGPQPAPQTSGNERLSAPNPAPAQTPAARQPVVAAQTEKDQPPNAGGPAPAKPKTGPVAAAPSRRVTGSLPVNVPGYVGSPSTSIALTARPSQCTPASAMPATVERTIALCSGQTYAPFRVSGDTITVYGDPQQSAVVRGSPRGYAITVSGRNIAIVGVRVEGATDPADLGTWLCLYDSCAGGVRGAAAYGGGILLDHTANAAVASSVLSGGPIGIASVGGSNNKLLSNQLSNQNAWGILLSGASRDYVVGNSFNNIDRSCTGPDGGQFGSGCESSALSVIRSRENAIVSNHCEGAANCYYAAGAGGQGSHDNKFYNNYCSGAGNNCFEVTFSQGNRFDYNTAAGDCDYAFWIGGSSVLFGSHNRWNCKHSAEDALRDAKRGTTEPTSIQDF